MATADLALGTMRVRQSTLSSLSAFLVRRGHLDTNPVARVDRPPHRREAPRQVPGSAIMDALIKAARERQRPRDLAIFLILRYSGMRRESVATLASPTPGPSVGSPQRPRCMTAAGKGMSRVLPRSPCHAVRGGEPASLYP